MLDVEIDDPPSVSSTSDREAEFKADLVGSVPFLRAIAIKMSRNRALAEDLAQESLTKAWQARGSYRAGTNLKAWLYTILRNEYSTHLRRGLRQVPWDAEAAETILAPHGAQRWASELTDVQRAMSRICIEQREALILVTVAGFSYEEAARITNVPMGTLKSRVSRARASIAKMFEQNVSLPRRKPSSEGSALQEFVAQVIALVPAQSGQLQL